MGKAGDPDRSVELLWGGRPGLSLEAVVGAAVEVADAEGLAGLSMRKVAERLGFTTMSLYRHVPGREHLVDLMRDAVLGDPPPSTGAEWRTELEAFARHAWELRKRHPWLAEARGRHVPGPNALAHYEHALGIVAGTGLPPAEVVAAVTLVGRFVDAEASALVEAARVERGTGVSDEQWWGERDALFARFDRYPVLTGLWEAGGFDQPVDPFEFGLSRLLDSIELLVQKRDVKRDETCRVCGAPVAQPASGRPRAYCSRACQQRAYRHRRST
ncbi:TetR family transcriptional regulator [Saccharothrix saharensis]|uniref:TetR family transcriptional regulator n=1 Tax=Saccharothrix saharensis TaxID=571190 RepID=A0A543JDQ8_9PSEU|nr:TetR/AcrR family transcriptional regulator C-terminal domain-containing protein [Saccharothrix saharensis]TQM80950.1 TetR family transcriptional regulator [Saccharothrix saharensis]